MGRGNRLRPGGHTAVSHRPAAVEEAAGPPRKGPGDQRTGRGAQGATGPAGGGLATAGRPGRGDGPAG